MKLDLMQNFRQVKFTSDHTLNAEQRKQLIQEKLERAERQLYAQKAYLKKLRELTKDA